MKHRLTAEEMIDYILIKDRSPETVRQVVRVNAILAEDEDLSRQMTALEIIYNQLLGAPVDDFRELLAKAARDAGICGSMERD